MKRFLSIALSAVALCATAINPMANKNAVVEAGNARFTVLTPEIIRIEYSPKGAFEDSATFAVINRQLPVPKFKVDTKDDILAIKTEKLSLRYPLGTDLLKFPESLSVSFTVEGQPVVWHPGMEDPQNLRGTYRTLDNNNADDFRKYLEPGLISRSGWAVIDDSPKAQRADGSRSLAFSGSVQGIPWVAQRADDDAMDIYLFAHGHDYKKALYDFTLLSGKSPLPPDYVFGYWYSKYDAYSSEDFRNIMKALADNDINTDVLILDMDWHWNGQQEVSGGRGGWTGWSWNTNLIPDPEGLLKDIHANRLRAALNLHPADGINSDEDFFAEMCKELNLNSSETRNIPWQLENKDFYCSFFKNIMRAREAQGVDFWWLDWQQGLINPNEPGLGQTFWCNHVFYNDMKKHRAGHRPVIFHRWGGLGSHRYQIGFSGDTFINYPTLGFEPYFTATASNVGYGYWGHDLGGHHRLRNDTQDPNDPELLLRWIQYGIFTPIFRTHASTGQGVERRIWTYPNFEDMNSAVKLRYALFPYIYTMARKSYDTGVGICRPAYYEYPLLDEAYSREDHYFFGDDIFVAAISTPSENGITTKEVWLPEGEWWSPDLNKSFQGGQTRNMQFTLQQYPWFIRRGAVIPMNPAEVKRVTERPENMVVYFVGGQDGKGTLYEDAGDTDNYDKEYATTEFSQKYKGKRAEYSIAARKGGYPGMRQVRSYEFRVAETDAPRKATMGGKDVKVSYDRTTRTATYTIPSAPASKARTLKVEF